MAASRPEPGPFTYTSTLRKPCSIASLAAASTAICAAKGVDFLEPLNPSFGACPRQCVAVQIGQSNHCIVKSRLDMSLASLYIFLFASFCSPSWPCCHSFNLLHLWYDLFLSPYANGPLGALSGSCVVLSALSPDGQAPPVAQSPVGPYVYKAFYIHIDLSS